MSEMENKKKLVINCVIPIDSTEEGKLIFEQFRICLESVATGIIVGGQVIEPLNSCCGK